MDLEEKAKEYFSIFVFKVEPCPQKNKHPWDSCDYCHPQENARRRDVRKYRYLAEACPDYKLHGYCALGNDCPFAHGVFEINLHPSKYRTQMCTEGLRCARKVCFFAHNDTQLRQPDFRFGYRNAAEAEAVKERLLTDSSSPHVVQVRAGGAPNSPLHRISPMQVAPGTPPQAVPPRLFSPDRVTSVADALRSLPLSLPPQTLGLSGNEAAQSLYELKGLGSWTGELDGARVSTLGSLSDRQPMGGSMDYASSHMLRAKASQQTRSLPQETGPRISMKVRRELGLEPPAKVRNHSLPAAGGYSQGGVGASQATPSLQSTQQQNSLAMRSILNNHSLMSQISTPIQHSTPLPLLPDIGSDLSGVTSLPLPSLGHRPLQPPHAAPRAGGGTLRVVTPGGVSLGMEEAMAQLGIGSANESTNDLNFVASALGVLGRLGYSLASEASSPTLSESVDKDAPFCSGHSSPVLARMPALSGMAAGLDLNAGLLSSTPAAAPGLANLGLSAGTSKGYNLFN